MSVWFSVWLFAWLPRIWIWNWIWIGLDWLEGRNKHKQRRTVFHRFLQGLRQSGDELNATEGMQLKVSLEVANWVPLTKKVDLFLSKPFRVWFCHFRLRKHFYCLLFGLLPSFLVCVGNGKSLVVIENVDWVNQPNKYRNVLNCPYGMAIYFIVWDLC